MVLTAQQITAFFTDDNNGMAMVADTVLKIRDEGINNPDNLRDFYKDTLDQVASSLRKPGIGFRILTLVLPLVTRFLVRPMYLELRAFRGFWKQRIQSVTTRLLAAF